MSGNHEVILAAIADLKKDMKEEFSQVQDHLEKLNGQTADHGKAITRLNLAVFGGGGLAVSLAGAWLKNKLGW